MGSCPQCPPRTLAKASMNAANLLRHCRPDRVTRGLRGEDLSSKQPQRPPDASASLPSL